MPIEIDPWPYRAAMLRLAVSILHHPQNAEDAVSQAMLQALRRSHTLRDPSAIKPWLLKITARCAYDLLRREKRRAALPEFEPSAAPFCAPQDSLFAQLCCLSPPFAQVLTLYYYENLSTAEIASVLAIPPATVRRRLSRARDQLKTLLQEEDG